MEVRVSRLAPKRLRIKEFILTQDEWLTIRNELTGACLSHTMGPNWRDLYYSPAGRWYVKKEV